MSDLLRNAIMSQRAAALAAKHKATKAQGAPSTTMDSAADAPPKGTTMDSAAAFDKQHIEKMTLSAINVWAGTDDLDKGETAADRLMGLLVGVADEDHDGEITEDEQAVLDVALPAAYDYLVTLGVSEEDAESLLNDWPADVGERVREQVALALPAGDEAEDAAIDALVFTPADQEPVFDSATMDAAYKKKVAVRGGRKVIIRKRIAGVVHLSGKQKVALRKARAKAFTAGAMARRAKSMRLRKSMGLS